MCSCRAWLYFLNVFFLWLDYVALQCTVQVIICQTQTLYHYYRMMNLFFFRKNYYLVFVDLQLVFLLFLFWFWFLFYYYFDSHIFCASLPQQMKFKLMENALCILYVYFCVIFSISNLQMVLYFLHRKIFYTEYKSTFCLSIWGHRLVIWNGLKNEALTWERNWWEENSLFKPELIIR